METDTVVVLVLIVAGIFAFGFIKAALEEKANAPFKAAALAEESAKREDKRKKDELIRDLESQIGSLRSEYQESLDGTDKRKAMSLGKKYYSFEKAIFYGSDHSYKTVKRIFDEQDITGVWLQKLNTDISSMNS